MTVDEIRKQLEMVGQLESEVNPDLDDEARLSREIAKLGLMVSQLAVEKALAPTSVSQRMEDLYNEGRRDAIL